MHLLPEIPAAQAVTAALPAGSARTPTETVVKTDELGHRAAGLEAAQH